MPENYRFRMEYENKAGTLAEIDSLRNLYVIYLILQNIFLSVNTNSGICATMILSLENLADFRQIMKIV
jgi:hypothetical protein